MWALISEFEEHDRADGDVERDVGDELDDDGEAVAAVAAVAAVYGVGLHQR